MNEEANGGLPISIVAPRQYALDELLLSIREENRRGEVDTGEPTGKEMGKQTTNPSAKIVTLAGTAHSLGPAVRCPTLPLLLSLHPLMTPSGRSWATFFDSPAPSTASTTSATSL